MEKESSPISGALLKELAELRHFLHAHPEVSGNEKRTAAALVDFIGPVSGAEIVSQVGGYGFLVVFNSGIPGPFLAFRADMDALDIQEAVDRPYRSIHTGISHACGHDGHSVILAGVARWLDDHPLKKGRVALVFQPSEENGEGAQRMLEDKKMRDFLPDYCYALHNLPGYPLHQVVVRKKYFTAYVKSLLVTLTGKTSHAAEPEHGTNPAAAMALLLHAAGKFTRNRPADPDFTVVTPVYARLGEKAYGVSAGYGEVHYTLRTWTEERMDETAGMLLRLVQKQAEEEGLTAETVWKYTFFPTLNHPDAVEHIARAARSAGLEVTEPAEPFKWGEDFGMFTRRFRGAMFGLGSGKNMPALHNPDYDFPDALLGTGIRIFTELLKNHGLI
ncbi:MAG: amidohydrolase [Bacteroidales bacterium]